MTKYHWGLLNFLGFSSVFIFLTWHSLLHPDTDLGWQLRIGQDFIKQGIIARSDNFSFTFSGFDWINHWWLSGILMYFIYDKFGYLALAFFYSAISLLAFLIMWFVCLRFFRVSFGAASTAALLALLVSLELLVIHSQVVALLGISVTILILYYHLRAGINWPLSFLPAIILIWTNLHGSFPIGLFLIAFYTLVSYLSRYWQDGLSVKLLIPRDGRSQKSQPLFLTLIISFLMTFLNPFGLKIWLSAWEHFTSAFLKQNIVEWLPVYEYPVPTVLFFFLLLLLPLFYLVWTAKKIEPAYFLLVVIFLVMAVTSRRHGAPLVLLAMVPIALSIDEILQKKVLLIDKLKLPKSWFGVKIFLLSIIIVGLIKLEAVARLIGDGFSYQVAYSDFYPVGASRFFKEVGAQGNLFNYVNWGGFLVWTNPELKVFIDGRMHIWKNGQATRDYTEIEEARTDSLTRLDDLNVSWVVYPSRSLFRRDDWLNRLVFGKALDAGKKEPDLPQRLKESHKWRRVYEDSVAVVYRRV